MTNDGYIADLRDKKNELIKMLKINDEEIKKHIKDNLICFKDILFDFAADDNTIDVKKGVIDFACLRINDLCDSCLKELRDCVLSFVKTRSDIDSNEIEDLCKVLYCLTKLKEKIQNKKILASVGSLDIRNEVNNDNTRKNQASIANKALNDRDFGQITRDVTNYNSDTNKQMNAQDKRKNHFTLKNFEDIKSFKIRINIKNCTVEIFDNDTVLLTRKIDAPVWHFDSKILDFYDKDFSFDFEIVDLKSETHKKKLEILGDVFANNRFDLKQICGFESKMRLETNTLIKNDMVMNKKTKKFVSAAVDDFVAKVIANDKDKEYNGLLISYFFVLCPGLIRFFEFNKYAKTREFYYFAWLRKSQNL